VRALALVDIKKFVSDITTSEVVKFVSAISTSLVASLRHIIPGLLVVLLFWILVEMAYCVAKSSYSKLLALFIIVLALLALVIVWKSVDLMKALTKPTRLTAYSENLKIIPFAILDLALVLAAIFVSSQMNSPSTTPLATPLLRFCQTIFNKLTS
jgi:hypothetical protein